MNWRGKKLVEIDRRHAVPGRQRNDQFSICIIVYVRHHEEAATWIARLCGDNAFDLILGVNRSGCVYRKPKPGHSGDEVRQGLGVN